MILKTINANAHKVLNGIINKNNVFAILQISFYLIKFVYARLDPLYNVLRIQMQPVLIVDVSVIKKQKFCIMDIANAHLIPHKTLQLENVNVMCNLKLSTMDNVHVKVIK